MGVGLDLSTQHFCQARTPNLYGVKLTTRCSHAYKRTCKIYPSIFVTDTKKLCFFPQHYSNFQPKICDFESNFQCIMIPICVEDPALHVTMAWLGFEPMIFGLRDRRLTTWPPSHMGHFPFCFIKIWRSGKLITHFWRHQDKLPMLNEIKKLRLYVICIMAVMYEIIPPPRKS
jgi:hypothetical protein